MKSNLKEQIQGIEEYLEMMKGYQSRMPMGGSPEVQQFIVKLDFWISTLQHIRNGAMDQLNSMTAPMGFTVTVDQVSRDRALQAANDIEGALGKIANGKMKPSALSLESISVLIQHTRNSCK